MRRAGALVLPQELLKRCEGTVGDWCGRFFMQKPVPAKVRPAVGRGRSARQPTIIKASTFSRFIDAVFFATFATVRGPGSSPLTTRMHVPGSGRDVLLCHLQHGQVVVI